MFTSQLLMITDLPQIQDLNRKKHQGQITKREAIDIRLVDNQESFKQFQIKQSKRIHKQRNTNSNSRSNQHAIQQSLDYIFNPRN